MRGPVERILASRSSESAREAEATERILRAQDHAEAQTAAAIQRDAASLIALAGVLIELAERIEEYARRLP